MQPLDTVFGGGAHGARPLNVGHSPPVSLPRPRTANAPEYHDWELFISPPVTAYI